MLDIASFFRDFLLPLLAGIALTLVLICIIIFLFGLAYYCLTGREPSTWKDKDSE